MITTTPIALFDSLEFIDKTPPPAILPGYAQADFHHSLAFLKSYRGSQGTFNAYRRELERFLHWMWAMQEASVSKANRTHIEAYIEFCQNPPKEWIGIKKVPKFIEVDIRRLPNPEWRPFVATVSKIAYRKGERADIKNFSLSQTATKEIFAILSTFYNYLIQEEYAFMNPVALIRQKSKFIRKQATTAKIRRLSETQWHYVITTAEQMAIESPARHERTLFIMTSLYAMYLRISELVASQRWTPQMNHFFKDHHGNWWFTTVGKGNKERQIAVSDAMLLALKRYRKFLGLTTLPSAADTSPILPKLNGKGPIGSVTYLRDIVQDCFDRTIATLEADNLQEDAENLQQATVHWLRHTGISDDVKHRPREHVRDDAGHSSSATTDRYIDVGLLERHASAKNKPVVEE
jgi:site-specific recombinase XerD